MGTKRNTLEDCYGLAAQNGGKCLSEVYINSKTKMLWECDKCHIFEMRYNNVQQGQWCSNDLCKIEKCEKTCMKRYGVVNPQKNKEIKRKAERTNVKKYGTLHTFQNEKIKLKIKKTMIERYGVENISQLESIKAKKKNKSLEKYGVACTLQAEEVLKKIKQTNLKKYGVENVSQSSLISLRAAKSQNNSKTFKHWKTNEEVITTASYEKAVVEWLNKNEIDYWWQEYTFTTPFLTSAKLNSTYRPDLYLPDKELWVEVKGWFRDEEAKEKWEWFHDRYPNSELWNKKKLKKMRIL